MALLLRESISQLSGVSLPYPTQANAVFVKTSSAVLGYLRSKGWRFYEFIGGAARFMTSWDTTREDVSALARDFFEATNK
jgi:threonine aldolase